jgi:uncharacterized membrane protein
MISVFASLVVTFSGGASVRRIPNYPGLPAPHPYAISADGKTVVGQFAPGQPFIWRGSECVKFRPSGNPDHLDQYSQAVSADGSTIVGKAGGAYLWNRRTGLKRIGNLPGALDSFAYGVSSDALVATGFVETSSGTRGFIWRAESGNALIPLLQGAESCLPSGVSGDGTTVVGVMMISTTARAFKFEGGKSTLLDQTSMFSDSFAAAVSKDGSVIGGYAVSDDASTPVLWINGTMSKLANLGQSECQVKCVSADGTVMGGSVGDHAAIWTADGKGYKVKELMQANGGPTNMTLETVTGIARVENTVYLTGWAHEGTKDAAYYAKISVR